MKKIGQFCCLLFLLSSSIVFSQKEKQQHFEKIRLLRVNYISNGLTFSVEEAEKFWPVFNEFEKTNRYLKLEEISKIKQEIARFGTFFDLSDQKAKNLLPLLREKLDAGASLVQIYTGMIFKGPGLASQIIKGLK